MIILVGVGLTWLIFNMFESFRQEEDIALLIWIGDKLNRKPFNCHFCLSFWVAVGFFATTGQYPAFIIPIAYEIVRRLINKL